MKKLLLVITFFLIVSLGACNTAPSDYVSQEDYNKLEQSVIELEERTTQLESTMDNLVCSIGLNGQYDCYVNQ